MSTISEQSQSIIPLCIKGTTFTPFVFNPLHFYKLKVFDQYINFYNSNISLNLMVLYIIIKFESMEQEKQVDLLTQFRHEQQEEAQNLRKQIFVQTKPVYRYDENPNPNAASRLVGKIYESYSEMRKSVFNMRVFLQNYRTNLWATNRRATLQAKLAQAPQSLTQQQRDEYQSTFYIILSFVLNHYLYYSSKQGSAIRNCINKLKVMIVKAQYRESTSLQYLIESYTSILRDYLNRHEIRYKQQKNQRFRLLQLIFARSDFIRSAFETLKNRFDVISLKELKLCKIAPHSYISELRKGNLKEKPIFFINFYTEPLLFIQNIYTKFDPNLLYCPLVTINNTVLLSEFYLRRLNQASLEWASQTLLIEIYHTQTSLIIPLFFDKINYRQNSTANPLKRLQEQEAQKSFRIKKELGNLNLLIEKITAIRKFVFVQLIFNWLKQLYGGSPFSPVHIDISPKFKAIIKIATGDISYSSQKLVPEERVQFFVNFLILIFNSKASDSKQLLKEKVCATFQAVLLKLIAQKTSVRVSWPMQNGSMGHYYYDFTKEKVLNRCQVAHSINNF